MKKGDKDTERALYTEIMNKLRLSILEKER